MAGRPPEAAGAFPLTIDSPRALAASAAASTATAGSAVRGDEHPAAVTSPMERSPAHTKDERERSGWFMGTEGAGLLPLCGNQPALSTERAP